MNKFSKFTIVLVALLSHHGQASGQYIDPKVKKSVEKHCASTKYANLVKSRKRKKLKTLYGSQDIKSSFLSARKKMKSKDYFGAKEKLDKGLANPKLSKLGETKLLSAKGYLLYKAGNIPGSIESYLAARNSEGANKWEIMRLDADIKALRETGKRYNSNAPTPIKRPPPAMPPKAVNSMFCRMAYQVNSQGKAVNMKAVYCTDEMFEGKSLDAMKKWSFPPFEGLGEVSEVDFTKFSFTLKDDCGTIVPETL